MKRTTGLGPETATFRYVSAVARPSTESGTVDLQKLTAAAKSAADPAVTNPLPMVAMVMGLGAKTTAIPALRRAAKLCWETGLMVYVACWYLQEW